MESMTEGGREGKRVGSGMAGSYYCIQTEWGKDMTDNRDLKEAREQKYKYLEEDPESRIFFDKGQ